MSTAAPTAASPTRAALLLARWWSRPTDAELAAWSELWPAAGETARALGLAGEQVDALRDAADTSSGEALRDEYERLLVGPGRAPCLPYESAWGGSEMRRREDGVLMSIAAEEVEAIYAELGLRLSDDAHELPDHVVVEWEAVAYALERGRDDASRSLLAAHLGRWMPPFCAAVAAESEQRFYRLLAEATLMWTAALGE